MSRSDHALFKAKVWFGTYYGCQGIIMPFFNVLLQRFGYAPKDLGIVALLRPIVSAVSGPIWAGAADHLEAHRSVFLLSFIVSTLCRASLALRATPLGYLIAAILVLEAFSGPVAIMSDTAIVAAARDEGDYGRCRFWACLTWGISGSLGAVLLHFFPDPRVSFCVYGLGGFIALAAALSLDFSFIDDGEAAGGEVGADALRGSDTERHVVAAHLAPVDALTEPLLPEAFHILSTQPSHEVSRQRSDASAVSSSSGWTNVPGPRCHALDDASESASLCTPLHNEHHNGSVHPSADAGGGVAASVVAYLRRATALILSRAMLTFLSKALVMGICVGVIDGFLFVYLQELGASALLMGAMLATICAIELPVFAYSGHLLAALGYNGSIDLALAAFVLRLAAYSSLPLMPSLWLVTPVELLHGITFGIAWSAGVNYCKKMAPAGLTSTAQGVFTGTYFGLGRGLGGLAGGLLFDRYGGAVMFRIVLAFTAAAWASVAALSRC